MSCGHERLVPGGLARHADDVHVVLDRVARRLLGRLEQRADVDVEAEVGERGGDHLGAAVVAVLAELGDEHARPAALALGERRRPRSRMRCELLVVLVGARRTRPRSYGSRRGGGRTPPPARRRSRRPSPGRAPPRSRARAGCRRRAAPSRERVERGLRTRAASRFGLHALEPRDLLRAHLGVVDVAHVDRGSSSSSRYLLTPTIDLLAAVDRGLAARRRLLDAQLRHARLDGLGHAAERLDLLDELPRLVGEALR